VQHGIKAGHDDIIVGEYIADIQVESAVVMK